jgi:2-polyprenyl-3-methyl-5-hydroxy-6-metoxy-1,4-benzoquinol methylase
MARLRRKFRAGVVWLSKLLSRQGLYPFLEGEFSQIPEGARVLNVGAGGIIGEKLDTHAGLRSLDVLSIDIDSDRGPDIVGDISDHKFGEQRFGAVVMSEVLEHIRTPEKAIQAAHAVLEPGGRLILSTPFIFPIHDRPHDYYRFTRYGLEWLLRDFSEVTVKERNSWAEAINVLVVRLIKEKNSLFRLAAPLIVVLALAIAPVAMILGAIVKTDFITSGYVVRAVK